MGQAIWWLLLLMLQAGSGSITNDSRRSLSQSADPNNNSTSDVSTAAAADNQERTRRRLKSSSLPEFAAPIGNVTAVLGRDVRLVCTVDHLGQYQVAWLKEETKTILSIDTNIIITNYRIFLIPDEEERKWVLHIKDVQESDRGFYLCQVNTNPTRSTRGYLEVVVPPTIIEAQSSQVAEVEEQANVSLQCRASGHPRPSVSWRRDDGQPIRLNGGRSNGSNSGGPDESSPQHPLSQITTTQALIDIKSDRLSFYHVDKTMAGVYVCTAANGIPSQAIKRIPLFVKFAPKTFVPNRYVSVSLGEQLEIECQVESFPKANSYWSKSIAPGGPRPVQEAGHVQGSWASHRHAISFRRRQLETPTMASNSSSVSLVDTEMAHVGAKRHHHLDHLAALRSRRQAEENHYQHRQVREGTVEGFYRPIASHQRVPSSASVNNNNNNNMAGSEVSVKHTALNSHTYKIKLSIAKTGEDDYGQYTCIANNPLGQSEAQVFVTRADRISRLSSQMNSAAGSVSTDLSVDYQRDSLELATRPQTRHSGSGGGPRVVYDENYLQIIRQNNQAQASSLDKLQKFKTSRRKFVPRHKSSDRGNKAARTNKPTHPVVLFFMLLLIFPAILQ